MDGNNDAAAGKCPFMHGKPTAARFTTRSNRDWWPNQLNLRILSQHRSSPTRWARGRLCRGLQGRCVER